MNKYLCLNPIAACGLDNFGAAYEKTETIDDATVVLVRSAEMKEMDLPESVLTVARAGAGVNNIPLEKYAQKGIVVFNTPGANANGVKELVIAGMINAVRHVYDGMTWVKDNHDDPAINKSMEKAKKAFAGTEIIGKKLGVIGLGAIGAMVANAADALGMNVVGYDPFLNDTMKARLNGTVQTTDELDTIFTESDFITVHVPANDATKGMVNEAAFAKMKDGVIILNFARDVLVDENAIEAAITAGKVACYVTDFPNAKTANMDKVIATPHLGASTAESEDNCAIMAVKEVRDYIENGNIVNSVNYPKVDLGKAASAGRIAVLAKAGADVMGKVTQILETTSIAGGEREQVAYVLADTKDAVTEAQVEMLKSLDGVIKVRVIK